LETRNSREAIIGHILGGNTSLDEGKRGERATVGFGIALLVPGHRGREGKSRSFASVVDEVREQNPEE